MQLFLNCNKATTKEQAKEMFDKTIKDGTALNKFKEIVAYQGGNYEVLNNYNLFKIGKNIWE